MTPNKPPDPGSALDSAAFQSIDALALIQENAKLTARLEFAKLQMAEKDKVLKDHKSMMEKMKLEHKEDMIKKDDIVAKARTAVAHAQGEIQKRDNDNAMLKMELFQIGAQQKKEKNDPEGYSSSKKRRRANSPPDMPLVEKPKPTRIVKCEKCFVNGWECDLNEPCYNCTSKGASEECNRVKCKKFEGNSCKNRLCGFAHQLDNYERLAEHIKHRPNNLGLTEPSRMFAIAGLSTGPVDDAEDSDESEGEDGGVRMG